MLNKIVIDSRVKIFEALRIIDEIGTKILFVTNNSNFVGALADSDIRRFLLSGGDTNDIVENAVNKNAKFVTALNDLEDVLAIFKSGVEYIPRLDELGRIVEILVANENKFYPISEPDLSGRERDYLISAFDSGWISSTGPFVTLFEEKFNSYLNFGHSVSVCNGTQAIALALSALGIKSGDEVIVPDLTFGATANAVVQIGAIPVIAEVDELTWNISIESLKSLISNSTKAIIPVHLYGQPCNMKEIQDLASKNNLLVIEDAAEALGTFYEGRHVGYGSEAVIFSFFGNKTISTGEGGMVVFKNESDAARAKVIRSHGFSPNKRYWHESWGTNMRMTNLQAAIGVAQLERVSSLVNKKIEIAKLYMLSITKYLQNKITFPIENNGNINSHWLSAMLLPTGISVEKIQAVLESKHIETRRFFYPLHSQPAFSKFKSEELLNASQLFERGICLPSSTKLTKLDIEHISREFAEAVKIELTQ
jgi:perosamine synthetase